MKFVSDHVPCFVGAAAVVWLDFFSEFELLTGISVESITPAEDQCSEHNSFLFSCPNILTAASKTQAAIAHRQLRTSRRNTVRHKCINVR